MLGRVEGLISQTQPKAFPAVFIVSAYFRLGCTVLISLPQPIELHPGHAHSLRIILVRRGGPRAGDICRFEQHSIPAPLERDLAAVNRSLRKQELANA